ncbi:Aste57867_21063 [Aphanomyces stellatus]|uniref:phospholipase D n=1 Tax=Aphanomyces stellatus TaxID=120398 RepID=A0A485LGJ3_9STRA|nr:hypothetical protein As57867_020995 [Aphanomyces stellatus]VFT97738.1 Aste57867_21063 [Aphanomyces stellatus]
MRVFVYSATAAFLLASHASATITCTKASFQYLLTYGCMCRPCHLCAHSVANGCQMSTPNAVTLSDGHDIATQQPLLAPTAWFLSDIEIIRARNGVPRTDIATYSTNNSVTVFPATNEFFRSMYQDISTTASGDAVYLNAWTLNNVPYIPDVDPSQTLQRVWADTVGRGVNVSALLFQNLEDSSAVAGMFNWFNGLGAPNAQLVLDNRAPALTGSLHQKATIIQRAHGGTVAYMGGTDHAIDRWDTKFHNESTLRKATNITKSYNGWVDVHSKIVGAATQDIFNTFLQRWSDPSTPLISPVFSLLASTTTGISDAPRVIAPIDLLDNLPANGSHAIQLARTYSCVYKGYTNFARLGETTILAARLKAIQNAKNFIYVEDQYFIHVPDLLDALLAVLPTIQRLVIVTCARSSMTTVAGYEAYLYNMVAPLQEKFPNKVQIYKSPADIFVHSKVLLVDDVFLSVGSSNWNVRSMTSDAEMAANIVDTATVTSVPDHIAVAALAHSFRLAKFGELTRFSIDFSSLTFVQAADALATYAGQAGSFITPYMVEYESYFAIYANAQRLFDGDGRCINTSPDFCANVTSSDYQVVQIACQCTRDKYELTACPAMHEYNHASVATSMEMTKYHTVLAISIAVLVAIVVLVGVGSFCLHRHCCKTKSRKSKPITDGVAVTAPTQVL